MDKDELDRLKNNVEEKLEALRSLIDKEYEDVVKKIDEVYERELLKTLQHINNRLAAIEMRFADEDATSKEKGK